MVKIKFADTEGRRVREDGRRVVVVWPFTDFNGYRLPLRKTADLWWNWYVVRPVHWAAWYVADAWDPHGPRYHLDGHGVYDASVTPRPFWWPLLWPVAALGRWVHRHCPERSDELDMMRVTWDDDEEEGEAASDS
ncbi:hypothetical protein TH66_04870 [Carbonactinospora thermoautotrophica]|uniref:Uncharacterized protein n=1 Tax=Carbonactinospora thermoautotrophica TaxID=1469144 RepID=A0A132NJ82_9ACTN|nr:hypothetical protein [Carbonactinospora thermoautotrophica]KWW99123.1 hypothetical protein LI90_756 [Carbonactinospora thermoautotrophica]KWX05072.1 hypothetical protein TH66_04870 [Carbonactinospora thermoautotrophica]KWX10138.1 hypothetical protein TR74_05415 [Carbonactinospora thermoautotrophica]